MQIAHANCLCKTFSERLWAAKRAAYFFLVLQPQSPPLAGCLLPLPAVLPVVPEVPEVLPLGFTEQGQSFLPHLPPQLPSQGLLLSFLDMVISFWKESHGLGVGENGTGWFNQPGAKKVA